MANITDTRSTGGASATAAATSKVRTLGGADLAAVMTEQLQWLIHNADRQRARLEKVKAILLAPFD
jgi:hypothetical protein